LTFSSLQRSNKSVLFGFGVEFKLSKSTGGHNMSTTITLPQTIFKKLEKISEGTRLTPQAIIKQAIADRIEYEEWALEQIDEGLADIKAGRVLSREEAYKKLGIVKHERKKAA
jgi:predicted transcriptional regulator